MALGKVSVLIKWICFILRELHVYMSEMNALKIWHCLSILHLQSKVKALFFSTSNASFYFSVSSFLSLNAGSIGPHPGITVGPGRQQCSGSPRGFPVNKQQDRSYAREA